jgi:hypothetical protein
VSVVSATAANGYAIHFNCPINVIFIR